MPDNEGLTTDGTEGDGARFAATVPARREPFRPWFTTSAEEELWLNAERTGDPWFADGDGESER